MCAGTTGSLHSVLERMFGFNESFEYFECARCGSLSQSSIPADLGRYYPQHYYSFHTTPEEFDGNRTSRLRQWALRKRNAAQLFGGTGFWGWVARWRPRPDLVLAPRDISLFPRPDLGCRILDVGCGDAYWLRRLKRAGFNRLVGIDPFLRVDGDATITLRRCTIEDIQDDGFDVIRFYHSLEHVDSPLSALTSASRLLAPNGVLVISVPVAESWLWKTFGVCWVELDAPRHVTIPSRKALVHACEAVGLVPMSTRDEEEPFEIWATELYARGISLIDPQTKQMRTPETYFSRSERERHATLAGELNSRGAAGRAQFIFAKSLQTPRHT